eukprot:2737445-Alexandrium_andersonii.AAC.1
MSCNVTALRPHMAQLMATLSDQQDSTRLIAIQEHATGPSAATPLCKLAAGRKLKAMLGPTDPDAAREAAGVGVIATASMQLAEVVPTTEAG